MDGFAATGRVPILQLTQKQRALDNAGRVRTKMDWGQDVWLAILGTSNESSFIFPQFFTNLPANVRLPFYAPLSSMDGTTSSAFQAVQAKGGARIADTGVAGMGQTQLSNILQEKHPWDACIVPAPVNDLVTSLATVNALLASVYAICAALSANGIMPLVLTWTGTSSSSVAFKRAYNLGLWMMCEDNAWMWVDVEPCTTDHIDGEENPLYVVDTVHLSRLGSFRHTNAIARALRGEAPWSHPLLPKARAHNTSITNQTWMNTNGGVFNDAAGAASLSGFNTTTAGGTATVRSATSDELEFLCGHVCELTRTANTGSLEVKALMDGSKTMQLGDELFVTFRIGGDLDTTTSVPSYYLQTYNAAPNEFLGQDNGNRGMFSNDFRTGIRVIPTSASATGQLMAVGISLSTVGGSFDSSAKLLVGQVGVFNKTAWKRAGFTYPGMI
ncbi:hypothetical protein CCB80_03330 [Armatimonadetes bacterium Uphvl-Ar1]|nr:hypothetical protein CCB80_03330 [Armatimonadetes bacterium Uphvl-Ar1]